MSASHWLGFGDASGPAGVSFNAQGQIQLPSASQIAAYLPPDFLSLGTQAIGAVQNAMGAIQGAQPALNLIAAIGSGSAPDPQMIIGSLSATVALINPVAGAVVGAAGELVYGLESATQSLFQSLGLISPPPVTYPFHGGIRQGQCVPFGRDDTNCRWQSWSYFAAPYASSNNGIPYEYMWQHILSNEDAASAGTNFYMSSLLYACNRYNEVAGKIGPNGTNQFETFFFLMLEKDFENWWNANPAIPPRDLLMGAIGLWNATHAGPSVSYSAAWATQGGANSPINWLLSQWGDASGVGRDAPNVSVNIGASTIGAPTPKHVISLHIPAAITAPAPVAPSPVVPSGLSTGAKVAVGGAALGGAALLGAAAYGFAKGQAVDLVLKHAWKHIKGWF